MFHWMVDAQVRSGFYRYVYDNEAILHLIITILVDPQDKLKHTTEAFQDCHIYIYILSFNEDKIHSLLVVISALEVNFWQLLLRPSRQLG